MSASSVDDPLEDAARGNIQDSGTHQPTPARPQVRRVYNVVINVVGNSALDATNITANLVNLLPSTIPIRHLPSTQVNAGPSPASSSATGFRGWSEPGPSAPAHSAAAAHSGHISVPVAFPASGPSAQPDSSTQSSASSSSAQRAPDGPSSSRPRQCSICFGPEPDRVLATCGHCVHKRCMLEWLGRKRVCPDPYCKIPCSSVDMKSLDNN